MEVTDARSKVLEPEHFSTPFKALTARLHEGNGDGVSEEHLDGGGGDGRQVEGAQLALQRQVNRKVAQPFQRAAGYAGHAHQARALCLHRTADREP